MADALNFRKHPDIVALISSIVAMVGRGSLVGITCVEAGIDRGTLLRLGRADPCCQTFERKFIKTIAVVH